MNTPSFAPEKDLPSPGLRLLLAAPIIWSVYHVSGYLLLETACTKGLLVGRTILGMNALSVVITILTLLALLPTLYIGIRSYRRSRESGYGGLGDNRERFLATVAGLFSIVLALTILADGAIVLVLGPCG